MLGFALGCWAQGETQDSSVMSQEMAASGLEQEAIGSMGRATEGTFGSPVVPDE